MFNSGSFFPQFSGVWKLNTVFLIKFDGCGHGGHVQLSFQRLGAEMVLAQGQVTLALMQVTAHQTPVCIFAAVILGQDFLAEGDARGKLCLIKIVLAQPIQYVEVRVL